MKILKSIWESRKSWKCRTPSENYENHEIIKTNTFENHGIMKILRIHLRNAKNDNIRNRCGNHANHNNLKNSHENYEKNENHRNPWDNDENHQNHKKYTLE